MKTLPMSSEQIKSLPNNVLYGPEFLGRRERRKLERQKPHLNRLFKQMESNKTLELPE